MAVLLNTKQLKLSIKIKEVNCHRSVMMMTVSLIFFPRSLEQKQNCWKKNERRRRKKLHRRTERERRQLYARCKKYICRRSSTARWEEEDEEEGEKEKMAASSTFFSHSARCFYFSLASDSALFNHGGQLWAAAAASGKLKGGWETIITRRK